MKVIAEITDEMFGKDSVPFNNPKIRYGARGIIERKDGLIAVFNKEEKNEYKLPGGGIDEGEEPEQAFIRECLEETGCEIDDINFWWITKELKSLDNFQQVSYVFSAKVIKDTGKLNLTEKEKDEGAKLLWLSPEEALEKIVKCSTELKESKYDNMYYLQFMNYRDREILKYYIKSL